MRETESHREQFKDSPLGRIPLTWRVERLANLAEFVTSGSRGWALYYSDTGARFIRIGNLTREHINLRLENIQHVNPPMGGEGQRTLLLPGDLLISITADLGIVGIVPSNIGEAYVNQHIALIRLQQKKTHGRWLGHYMAGQSGMQQIRRLDDSGAKAGLSLPTVRALLAALPPMPEQRHIAEVLDAIDDAIRKTEQCILKLKQMKQGLLHDLLTRGIDENGELRDPQRYPEQFTDSLLGRIPREWTQSDVRSLATGGLSNGVFKEPRRTGHGCLLINVGDLYGNFGVDTNQVERFEASSTEIKRYCVQPGDIFFTRSSLMLQGIAQCNIVRAVREPTVFECHLIRMRVDPLTTAAPFVAYWCQSPPARAFLMARAKQVTMTTIAQPDLGAMFVPLPALAEQHEIVDRLDTLDARIRSETAMKGKLSESKRGLMDDLLTGRVRTIALDGANA